MVSCFCTFSKHAFLSFSDFKGLLFITLSGIDLGSTKLLVDSMDLWGSLEALQLFLYSSVSISKLAYSKKIFFFLRLLLTIFSYFLIGLDRLSIFCKTHWMKLV